MRSMHEAKLHAVALLLLGALAAGCRPHATGAAAGLEASAPDAATEHAAAGRGGGHGPRRTGSRAEASIDIATDGAWVYFVTQEGLFEVPARGGSVQPVHLDVGRHARRHRDRRRRALPRLITAPPPVTIVTSCASAAHGAAAHRGGHGPLRSRPPPHRATGGSFKQRVPARVRSEGPSCACARPGASPEILVDDLERPWRVRRQHGRRVLGRAPAAAARRRRGRRARVHSLPAASRGARSPSSRSPRRPRASVGIAGTDVLLDPGRAGFDHGAPHDVPYDGVRRAPVAERTVRALRRSPWAPRTSCSRVAISSTSRCGGRAGPCAGRSPGVLRGR